MLRTGRLFRAGPFPIWRKEKKRRSFTLEERQKKVQGFEAEDHAAALPGRTLAGIFGERSAGQIPGDGGEEDAPPHGGAGERHGQKPGDDGDGDLLVCFHKNTVPIGCITIFQGNSFDTASMDGVFPF